MERLLLPLLLASFFNAQAQDHAALRLWADPQRSGPVRHAFDTPGLVEELPLDLSGDVSSLEVASGFVVTLFDREDGRGAHNATLTGPCVIDDLHTLPMLGLHKDWDGALMSVRIEPSRPLMSHPGVIAAITP